MEEQDKKAQVIGLLGEMHLAMILHEKGWQVHKSYIDEGIDLVITKYWCSSCQKFTSQYIKTEEYEGKQKKCVTNLCEFCQTDNIELITKYLQIKTSEGIPTNKPNIRKFSFHPKIRYMMDKIIYYVWIAVFPKQNEEDIATIHYYIFNTRDVVKFDDISLDTYQITDNQKTTLMIDITGKVLNKGIKYSYSCFNTEFHNNFSILDEIE